ncbi:MAG: LLM class F420-dependent oxidoreductase [Actinobacteria bacterium]|nr:LLM class F420-dependent oxidoreductase [Actinomycetota bacterium]MCL6104564.1 LLM class F420-dependent oxidoreductase [Actinomycetota bacterium]
MKFRIFVEPQQGASYEQQLVLAQTAETLGFDAFFRSDHFLRMGEGSPLPGPTDSWVTLAGLARETSKIRLGTLVSSATFRLPGPFATIVAQVDAMSNGRVELGFGTGWFEDEHKALGIPFPSVSDRFMSFEEQLSILTGIWLTPPNELFSFSGKYFTLQNCPALPRPVQNPHPPIIIGGLGKHKTPLLAARFAKEYNVPFAGVSDCVTQYQLVETAAEKIGRDPSEIHRSVAVAACVGATQAEFHARAANIGREPEDLRLNGVGGVVDEAVDKLNLYRRAGAETVYLQILDISDLEHLELIASQVMPKLA